MVKEKKIKWKSPLYPFWIHLLVAQIDKTWITLYTGFLTFSTHNWCACLSHAPISCRTLFLSDWTQRHRETSVKNSTNTTNASFSSETCFPMINKNAQLDHNGCIDVQKDDVKSAVITECKHPRWVRCNVPFLLMQIWTSSDITQKIRSDSAAWPHETLPSNVQV